MEYQEALEVLEGALKFGIDPSLEPIAKMCAQLGNPQDSFKCIQVAGTNGKSSTVRFIAALLQQQGFKTGLYTSPELVRYPERMEIGGQVVPDQQFADAVEAAQEAARACGLEATEFELLTAGALWLFAREGVEWAVLECGLGGRWDATSVCSPQVSVITGIALDHTRILGDTLPQIAAEKAAIIKPCCKAAVLAAGLAEREVFQARAQEVGVPVVDVSEGMAWEVAFSVDHLPSYQEMNAATAFTAVRQLMDVKAVDAFAAWSKLQIPGRFETLQEEPLLLIDAAHNPQSAQTLAREVARRWPQRAQRPVLLLGVLADKDVRGVVEAVAPLFGRIACTQSDSPRAISAQDLAAIVEEVCKGKAAVIPSIPQALELLAGKDVIATGSITVAGQVKGCWLESRKAAE